MANNIQVLRKEWGALKLWLFTPIALTREQLEVFVEVQKKPTDPTVLQGVCHVTPFAVAAIKNGPKQRLLKWAQRQDKPRQHKFFPHSLTNLAFWSDVRKIHKTLIGHYPVFAYPLIEGGFHKKRRASTVHYDAGSESDDIQGLSLSFLARLGGAPFEAISGRRFAGLSAEEMQIVTAAKEEGTESEQQKLRDQNILTLQPLDQLFVIATEYDGGTRHTSSPIAEEGVHSVMLRGATRRQNRKFAIKSL